ncbi:hypothetical protein HaLaN_11426 [Haematococcus lacustris]|uniref:Uncharacterized protein n=1 Tax=Haematococcus lacustris TaxID=44745 RepID=A0A699YY70_HAELA|nr:hypothetical protein HaLaN_11426 [Haematococcus lacustris]
MLSLQLQCLDLSGSTILRPGSTILQPEQPGAPLAQHLTQLCIGQAKAPAMVVLGQVPLLQVLTLAGQSSLDCLPQLLQLLPALPQLHTLQLPEAEIRQQQLDALLAATQITSVQLIENGDYENESDEDEGRGEPTWSEIMYGVAAAVRNLTQACKVAVEINVLQA